jgi:hypothetical protein
MLRRSELVVDERSNPWRAASGRAQKTNPERLIDRSVAAKLERIGDHAEFGAKLLGQPLPSGNSMEAHPISILRQQLTAPTGLK